MDETNLATLRKHLGAQPVPVPEAALALLHETAGGDTGGSQAARNFLFWLAGQSEPS